MTRNLPDRVHGIEFRRLEAKLDELDFPVSTDELLEAFGDHPIGTQRGSTRLEDVLEPRRGERFDSPEEVRRAVVGTIGEEAIGRKGYSDRDPPTRGEAPREDRRTL